MHLIMDNILSRKKIVPGKNYTYALVFPQVMGHFSRCPCVVGACTFRNAVQ